MGKCCDTELMSKVLCIKSSRGSEERSFSRRWRLRGDATRESSCERTLESSLSCTRPAYTHLNRVRGVLHQQNDDRRDQQDDHDDGDADVGAVLRIDDVHLDVVADFVADLALDLSQHVQIAGHQIEIGNCFVDARRPVLIFDN